MKNKRYILTLAALIGAFFTQNIVASSLPAPMPEFQSQEQLAKSRAESSDTAADRRVHHLAKSTVSHFYTGRPYDSDYGSYKFKYRTFDPAMNRWTTPDPSGFPDGANNTTYAPTPTGDFDFQGLLKWSTLAATGFNWTPTISGNVVTYTEYQIYANDGTTSLNIYQYASGTLPPSTDFTYNCFGYVVGNSQYWINPIASFSTPSFADILRAEGFKEITDSIYTTAKVALWGNDHTAVVDVSTASSVTQVTGKLGGSPTLLPSTPASQWSGTPSYWE